MDVLGEEHAVSVLRDQRGAVVDQLAGNAALLLDHTTAARVVEELRQVAASGRDHPHEPVHRVVVAIAP